MPEYPTRMGDGRPIKMDDKEIKDSLDLGQKDAAERAGIPELTSDELEILFEIITDKNRFVSVEPGEEIVMTNDVGPLKIMGDQANSGVNIPVSREQAMVIYERMTGVDTLELGHIDYSYKPVKPIISQEQSVTQNCNQMCIAPMFYGAMPNIGLYYKPDGPFPEPITLTREGKFDEAKESMEGAVESLVDDLYYIARYLVAVGLDAFNIDTTAAGGDPDFYATLLATERLKKDYPELSVEMGMAGEFILGFHADLKYGGELLAGMWPHQQVKVAEKAGADIFGPVMNTKPGQDFPWNLARCVNTMKACVEASVIPVHVDMGMGVGGIPMYETPPIDAVTRANKAMVKVARVDGI